eukprot:COSAG01_NODE_96_length_26789_cov_36.697089_40_plen_67_part_00
MPEGELFSTRLLQPQLGCFQVREGRPPASAFASRFASMLLHARPPAAACAAVLSRMRSALSRRSAV